MNIKLGIVILFTSCFAAACSSYQLKNNEEAHNSLSPTEIVQMHLRALEEGNWELANSYLSDDYKMKMEGMPFFVKIKKEQALDMHKARKQAFPDFKFNEQVEWAEGNEVKVAVFLSGTHTGLLDYPKNVGVPKTEPTGKSIQLPSEYFTYAVEHDKIVYTYGMIPDGHGPAALMQQLGISQQ